jgi:hypothetical protein
MAARLFTWIAHKYIGNFEKGIYYVKIINQKGERVVKSFVKL